MSAISGKLPAGLRQDEGRRNRLLNILLALLLVIGAVAAYLAVGQSSSTSSGAVRTATVSKGVVLSSVSASGTVQAPQEVTANFTTSGTLVQVDVKPGETVQAGQPLGSIDPTSAQQQVSQAESGVETANAQLQLTLTGETPQQRAQDALSVAQARQSLANAKSALTAAKKSVALDKLTNSASLSQAQKQLRADQGQLQVDLAKQKTDSATYATSDAAAAAVATDKAKLAADQAKQQQDQQSQLVWQQQQSSDQSSLSTAKANNDLAGITNYTNAVSYDQSQLNALARMLQSDGFAITADQNQLSADQTAQTTLLSDAAAIKSDEQKLAQDHVSITNAKNGQTGTRLKDAQSLQSARQQLSSAQLGLKSTLLGIKVKQAPPTPSALAQAHASVVQATIALANAKLALANTTLRAPIGGVVADVNGAVGTQTSGGGTTSTSSSSSSSSSGGTGSTGGSSGFVTLTNVSGMQVVAGFSEIDAAKIRVGQAATVTVDAIPNETFAAHVISVATTATTSSNVVTYPVTFVLDNTASGLKPGMSADVDVVVAELDNVLHVTTAAVRGSGRNATVTVLRNGKQVTVPVVAGLQGDSSTAILGGLTNGETVVLPSVSVATSSASGGLGSSGTTTTTGSTSRFRGGGGFGGGLGGGFGP